MFQNCFLFENILPNHALENILKIYFEKTNFENELENSFGSYVSKGFFKMTFKRILKKLNTFYFENAFKEAKGVFAHPKRSSIASPTARYRQVNQTPNRPLGERTFNHANQTRAQGSKFAS